MFQHYQIMWCVQSLLEILWLFCTKLHQFARAHKIGVYIISVKKSEFRKNVRSLTRNKKEKWNKHLTIYCQRKIKEKKFWYSVFRRYPDENGSINLSELKYKLVYLNISSFGVHQRIKGHSEVCHGNKRVPRTRGNGRYVHRGFLPSWKAEGRKRRKSKPTPYLHIKKAIQGTRLCKRRGRLLVLTMKRI